MDKQCPGGDCLCDYHEGKTDRLHSRAVRNRGMSTTLDETAPEWVL